MHMLYCAAVVKEELSLNVKLWIYRSLTSGHKIWVVTKRIRSWIKAAVICFLYRMSGRTLQAKTLPTNVLKHKVWSMQRPLQLDYDVVALLSGQAKPSSMIHAASFSFKLYSEVWQEHDKAAFQMCFSYLCLFCTSVHCWHVSCCITLLRIKDDIWTLHESQDHPEKSWTQINCNTTHIWPETALAS